MQNKNMPSVQEIFQQMSTEELRAMLDQELHSETVNDNAVRLIVGILRERNKVTIQQVTPETMAAWEKYQKDTERIYKPARRAAGIRRWMIRSAAAAAMVALLLVPVIPREAGAESLWETLTRWTSEVMEFFGYQDNEDRLVDYEFKTDNPGLQQVYDKAVELGVTVPVVPMWLPEGYELVECRVIEYPVKTRLYSRFSNSQNGIVFCVDVYFTEISRKYQKDETIVEVIESDAVNHQIISNLDAKTVIWKRDKIECSLVVNNQEDSVHQIVNSIYNKGG